MSALPAEPPAGPALPVTSWANATAWDREYGTVHAIPSSLRDEPSHALRRLLPALGQLDGAMVLDVGAGTGRHTRFLSSLGARCHAVDCSPLACDLHRSSPAAGVATSIEIGVVAVGEVPARRYDLIIDSYVSCHILSADDRYRFLAGLLSALKPGGRLYTAGMGTNDTFYRRHLVPGLAEAITVDPSNEIAKLLQPAEIAERDSGVLGAVIASTTERFTDIVAGRIETREVHAAVLKR